MEELIQTISTEEFLSLFYVSKESPNVKDIFNFYKDEPAKWILMLVNYLQTTVTLASL